MYNTSILKVGIRTLLYKSLAISLSLIDNALHSVNFFSSVAGAGAPVAPENIDNAAQTTNNNDEFMVTKRLVQSC